MDDTAMWPGSEEWGFFGDQELVFFGPVPTGNVRIDLIHHRWDVLDNLQIITASAYLSRVGRRDDAARLFATQTGCTIEQGYVPLGDPEPPGDPASFPPPPWPVANIGAMNDAVASRRRWALASLAVGIGVPLALIALAVWLIAS